MDDLKQYKKSKKEDEKDLDSLIKIARMFSKDIGMQFTINKCTVLIMKGGK